VKQNRHVKIVRFSLKEDGVQEQKQVIIHALLQ
jgi:hypothetical protein